MNYFDESGRIMTDTYGKLTSRFRPGSLPATKRHGSACVTPFTVEDQISHGLRITKNGKGFLYLVK